MRASCICNWAVLLVCYVALGLATHTVDGDTFDATLRVWHTVSTHDRVRVFGVNTPERGQPGYDAAKAFTDEWLKRGPFAVRTCELDRSRRVLGIVTRDSESLADELIKRNLAVPYKKL